jgi:hypothetical protein
MNFQHTTHILFPVFTRWATHLSTYLLSSGPNYLNTQVNLQEIHLVCIYTLGWVHILLVELNLWKYSNYTKRHQIQNCILNHVKKYNTVYLRVLFWDPFFLVVYKWLAPKLFKKLRWCYSWLTQIYYSLRKISHC